MRRGFAVLATAAAALIASIGAQALPPPMVNDALILGEAQVGGKVVRFPRTLGDYGFFRDGAARVPTPGVIPYELNTPLYSDGADKLRYIYVPKGESLKADGDGLLQFPVGSAILKTFAFGEGKDQRFIETRVLLKRANGWLALPYKWNEEQTEAKLALVGARMELTRPDGKTISYQIPNKNQCKQCHVKDDAVTPIGPKVRNLSDDWLKEAKGAGIVDALSSAIALAHSSMPKWNDRANVPIDLAARAYLDVNCAHCHQPGGSASNSGLDLRWEQDDPHAIGIRKPPVAAGRGAGGHAVSIAPGDPDASILAHRMSSTEPGVAMPELGRSTNDPDGIAVIRKWIAEMKSEPAT